MSHRIGSICSGTGALDMAVHQVLGAETAWFCQYEPPDKDDKPDRWQFASRILAHHWPDVPNHGDITKLDWATVEKVEGIIAGWPCENMSLAGRREGLVAGVQSGLWFNIVDAIRAQQAMREPGEPGPFIFLENVRGLLSARADSDVEPCPWCLGDVEDEPDLRALGAVLGDLAELGFDAEWTGLPASGVGACHERWREFILAWPATADPAVFGHERGRPTRERRHGSADGGEAAAHPDHVQHLRQPGEQPRGSAPAGRRDGTAADARSERLNSRAHSTRRESRRGDASHRGSASGVDWGPYRPAIDRHERVFSRPAPRPTQPGRSGAEQLSPRFTEWMMGLPAGHVTDVPRPEGMSAPAYRNACITACGKGVVPAQAAHALRILLDRAGRQVAA
ncbi:DNA cytosine methyltransferase [Nonomuraea sp. NPDC049714]|uniref:DNA cytosine methyltransferase n=1 Tax=Nonomuraea sp. NPDC049714 TaxID=3364357 RepID=UPI0037A14EA6